MQPHHRAFCSDHTLLRYTRARNGDTQKALAMLLATVEWRDSFGVDQLTPEGVRPNGETGKVLVCGPDMGKLPLLVLRPGRENSKDDHDGNLRHLVYQLERCVKCMDEDKGISKMTVVLDMHNYSSMNAPPMRTSRATLDILQNHYPERLASFIIINAPWIFYAFFKVISPFIDRVTAAKIRFVRFDPRKEPCPPDLAEMVSLKRIPSSVVDPSSDTAKGEDSLFFNPDAYFSRNGEEEQRAHFTALRKHV